MKHTAQLVLLCVVIMSSCENSKVKKNNQTADRSNQYKTSEYGGCDFKTDCWDYKGSGFQNDFQTAQLKVRCQTEGGQYVANGCTHEQQVASCVMSAGQTMETVLHYYESSGLTFQDAEQLCTAQEGVIQNPAGESKLVLQVDEAL